METISICIGSACHLKGSYRIIEIFKELITKHNLEKKIELKAAFCMGECTSAVSVKFGENKVIAVSPETAEEIFLKNMKSE